MSQSLKGSDFLAWLTSEGAAWRMPFFFPCFSFLSIPVATTVTITSSSRSGLIDVPKMMLTSFVAAWETIFEASSVATSDKLSPPVILSKTFSAPSIETSSNGEEIACFVASAAAFSPVAVPIPIKADPWFCITVLTSAKSRLTIPGEVIKSEMPCTPWRKTLSASLNASRRGVFLSTISSKRLLAMTTSVSTWSLSCARPSAANRARLGPSNVNGRVTTPTVNAPWSLAILATIGAAPVPVPPPMPAVTKTMSAPSSASEIASSLSWAALLPVSGFEPAPSPRVNFGPSWIFVSARELLSAWTSVLATMNSTPLTSSSIIRLTAFPPAPPTPITLIVALFNVSVSSIE